MTKDHPAFLSREDPDVVYLQEVVPASLPILEEKCAQYHMLPGGSQKYFTAMMLKVSSVTVKGHEVLPFHSSVMMRNLLKVEVSGCVYIHSLPPPTRKKKI